MKHYARTLLIVTLLLFTSTGLLLTQPYYINCGPPTSPTATTVSGGITFQNDGTYLQSGGTANANGNTSQANTDLDLVYQSERWKDGSIEYAFPVSSGTQYIVDLYFSETFNGTSDVGLRQFDVTIEGALVLDDFDVYFAAGNAANTAVNRSFTVTPADNTLNIDFLKGPIENPKISGIVIRETGANTAPEALITSPINNSVFNENQTLSFAGLRSDLESLVDPTLASNWYTNEALQWYLTGDMDTLIGTGADFILPGTDFSIGDHTLEARIDDDDGVTGVSAAVSFSITRDLIDLPFYMNAGINPSTETINSIVWNDDADYLSQGAINNFPNNNSNFSIQGTEFDAVFGNEAWSSGNFTYSFPVDNGTYTVELLFAEISGMQSSAGARQFNVDIEGVRQLTDFDIFTAAGGALRAITRVFVVNVNDGVLDVNFSQGDANNPKISGIVICSGTNATCNAALPVTWLDWSGKAHPDRAELFWSTSAEQDNRGFYVERSIDGRTFREIGFVPGNGDRESTSEYTFTDPRFADDAYYRLRQVDYDGAFEYSSVIFLKHPAPRGGKFQLYPNPATDRVTLIAPSDEWEQREIAAALYGVDGRLLLRLRGTPGQLSAQLTEALPTTTGRLLWLRLTYDGRVEQLPLLR